MERIFVELLNGSKCVNMITEQPGGQRKEKLITIENFVASIAASVMGKNLGEYLSPIFREVKGVRLIQSKQTGANSRVYVLFQGKHNTPIEFFNRFYDDVGVPNLLYGVQVVKDTEILRSTKLYKYPLTNVSGELGTVCLGRNTFDAGIEDNDLEKLYHVPYQFMSMPNNLDHYRVTSNTKHLQCEELIKSLNHNTFDDELLVENDKKTFSEWFSEL